MNLLDLEGKKIVIHPSALVIKEFKAIWDRDKSKTKELAIEELGFLWFYCHYKSPYRAYEESERFEKIKRDVITDKNWKPDELLEKARTKYMELTNTPSMGLLNDAETGAFKIRNYFATVDLSNDRDGKKVATLVTTLSKVTDIVKSLYSLRELVEKEMYEKKMARGNKEIRNREIPKNKQV